MADSWPALYSHSGRAFEDLSDTLKQYWAQYHAGSVAARKRTLPSETAALHENNQKGAKRLAEGRDPRADTPPPPQDSAITSGEGESIYISNILFKLN